MCIRVMTSILFCLALSCAVACGGCSPPVEDDLQERANAVELVDEAIECDLSISGATIDFIVEELQEGWCVQATIRINDDGAIVQGSPFIYWVHEGNTYWISESASECSQTIDEAPKSVVEASISLGVPRTNGNSNQFLF